MNRVVFEDLENVKSRDIPWEKLKGKTVLISGAYGMLASYVTFMLIHLNEEYGYGIRIIALVRSKEKALRRFDEYAKREYFTIRTDSLDEPLFIGDHIDFKSPYGEHLKAVAEGKVKY